MQRALDAQLAVIGERQHSVFSRYQALEAGFTDGNIRYRLGTGRWVAVDRGVYAIAGAALSWESRVMARLLRAPTGSAAGLRTASRLWKAIPDYAGEVEILVPHGSHHRQGRYRQAVRLGAGDVRRLGPIRLTSPGRTLVDLAGILPSTQLEAALDEFVALRLISVHAVRRYIADRGLGRRRGVGSLRELLDDREKGIPQKELERRFIRFVRRQGLPEPVRQQPEGSRFIDFAYPQRMIAIEVDGFISRGTPRALRRDVNRQNEIVLAGWTILRFTWDDVTKNPDYVAGTILTALTKAGYGRRPAPIRS